MNDSTNYTIAALRQELRERGLLTEGNKAALLLRLKNFMIREQMNQPNAAEFLTDVEISTEQADSVNEENANSTERETEQLANESIQQELESVKQELDSIKDEKESLQQELESVKQELDSTKREKNLLQQELESVERERDSTQRDMELLRRDFNNLEHDYGRLMQRQDQNMPLSPEVRPSTSRVTSTTSRNVPYEFNRRNNYDRFEESRYRTRWRNQPEYERNYRRGRQY